MPHFAASFNTLHIFFNYLFSAFNAFFKHKFSFAFENSQYFFRISWINYVKKIDYIKICYNLSFYEVL